MFAIFVILLLTIISFVSLVSLPKVLLFVTYKDMIFRSIQLLHASILPDYKYTDMIFAHVIIFLLCFARYVATLFSHKRFSQTSNFKPIFLRAPDRFPTHILDKIKYTLRELKIDYKLISAEHNKRILLCSFRIEKMRQLTNLQGYFLKNPDIHSIRVTRSRMYKNVVEIEAGYAPECDVDICDLGVFRYNRSQVFITLGKDSRNTVFVEKLSSMSIFGKAKSGKTNLLRQIAYSLTQQEHGLEIFLPRKFADLAVNNAIIYDDITSIQRFVRQRKIVIIDDVDQDLNSFKQIMTKSREAYYIVSTNIVYDDFIKHAFSRKAIFKLNDTLEKQFLSTRDLPNEGLLDFDDYYYVTPKSTFRITSSRKSTVPLLNKGECLKTREFLQLDSSVNSS